MLTLSDTNLQEVSSLILGKGHDVGFLVPTKTGLEKSILDAHGSLRAFLSRNEVHEFEGQTQGVIRHITAIFISDNSTEEKQVSLYRPKAKNKSGDPRIWISGLNKLAAPNNLLALIAVKGDLFIMNCSKLKSLEGAISEFVPRLDIKLSETAEELLNKLTLISNKGFISTVVVGDTGVGMTLEAELGIKANSSRSPDYKGIELKSSRVSESRRSKSRNQLFSKAPNWKLSPIKTAKELINKRGYVDNDGLQALRHTVKGSDPNSLGLFLDIDYANAYLKQMSCKDMNIEHDTTWLLDDLKKTLLKKHKETFWVKAKYNKDSTIEKFHYVEVVHSENPFVNKFETLVETGLITLDYLMYIKENGVVRDHGYSFKLHQNNLTVLFPATNKYDLTKKINT